MFLYGNTDERKQEYRNRLFNVNIESIDEARELLRKNYYLNSTSSVILGGFSSDKNNSKLFVDNGWIDSNDDDKNVFEF
jgi:Zn-dependent M16 (insulinase) family peptidase